MRKILLLFSLAFLSHTVQSQRGTDGSVTVSAASTQLNAYTSLTANAAVNAASITVEDNTLLGGMFSVGNELAAGDLILIIQMQGASLDIDPTYATATGGFTSAFGHSFDWWLFKHLWGQVTSYNNAGKYEFAEVRDTPGSTSITLQCGLKNAYTAAGKVQIVRVPRIQNLTLNANTSVVPSLWDGSRGGIVALEVNGNVVFGNNSRISATGAGFRGGALSSGGGSISGGNPGFDNFTGTQLPTDGAEKGEGIGGFTTEYSAVFSRYGNGAPGNGGGGGGNQNAGGGGGANVSSSAVPYTGKGVPVSGYNAAWEAEAPGLSTSSSPGGGRGGYTFSTFDANALTLGPNQAGWASDYRREDGGFGGHNLTYDATRVFAGGGGGAGHQNQSQGGAGGRGGGIVFLTAYGTVTGAAGAVIEANGSNGGSANPGNNSAGFAQKLGNDGAGGAGGGGAVIISNGSALPANLSLSATGGTGGNQNLSIGQFASSEADGPGGGGAGGMLAFTSGSPLQSVAGGANGITTSAQLTEFPPNGATGGAAGIAGMPQPYFDINASNVSICSSGTATLTATVTGTLPPGSAVTWYSSPFGPGILGTGLTYTTGVLATTTTVYVGTCPGTFRKPVVITVGGPSISGTAVITNVTCSTPGSITGLTTTGGAPTVTVSWNGVTTPGMNLTNASAGTYNVLVTDGAGCTATSGPYTIGSAGGPTINTTNIVVTPASCSGNTGSVSGITTTGTITSVSWNSGAYSTLNISSLPAGNYNLLVTDNNGCTASAGPINVGVTPGPVISTAGMTITDATCGNPNGSITGITATGNSLTYEWNATASAGTDLSGAGAGSYTLVAEDNLGCTATAGPFTITATAAPVLSTAAMVITDEHCGNASGSITGITVSGGSPGYLVSWNGGAYTTLDISGITAGTYNLSVSDNSGCVVNAGPFTVANIAGPVINTASVVIAPESCSGNDGSITGITVTGTGTLSYSWNLAPSPSADLANKPAGIYILVVTDQFGCSTISTPQTIGSAAGPAVNTAGMTVVNENCLGNNGSVSGIVTTGTITSVSWNSGAYNTLDISGLTAGTYTLVVTDNNGCTATSGPVNVALTPGPAISTAGMVITNSTCGNPNGSITGITSTGNSLTYEWNAISSPDEDLTGASAGAYTLVAENDLGCTATAGPFTISNTAGPSLSVTDLAVVDEHCNQDDGSISGITISGGTLPYTVSWNGGAFNTLDITGLSAGAYNLSVSDGNSCVVTSGPHTILNTAGPVLNTGNIVITPESCAGNDASITGITASGEPVITYQWNLMTATSSASLTGIPAGTYALVATDGFGCQANAGPFTVPGAVVLNVDITNAVVTNTSCTANTGAVTGINVTGGVNPVISWSNGASTEDISGLAAGNYTITVTDDQDCEITEDFDVFTVNGPVISTTAAVITAEHCDQGDGSVTGIAVSGGTPVYTFNWDGGATEPDENLSSASGGQHILVVTDNAGCTATTTITIPEAGGPQIDASNVSITNASCGDQTGAINGLTVNGSAPYAYSWTNSTATTLNLANVSPGSYVFSVEDAFGCVATSSPFAVGTTPVPDANFTFSPGNPSPNEPVLFTDASAGATITDWSWNIDSGSEISDDNQFVNVFTEEAIYQVELIVQTADGCIDSVTKIIIVLGEIVIPNVLTRNGDNNNDVFLIKNLKPDSELVILNRWGNLVFSSKDYKNDWRGTDAGGEMLSDGVYTYQLINAEGKMWQGFVHLLNE